MGISQTKTSYKAITDAIATRIAAVPKVGKVHSFQRWVNNPEKRRDLFNDTSNDRLSVWMVSRASFSDTQSASTANAISSLFVIRGYMAVDDDSQSEHVFQKLIDDVSDAFRPQDSLGDLVESLGPVQARIIGYADWSGYMVHSTELVLTVNEFIIP